MPLGSLGRFKPTLEYGVVWERDRQPTITVQSDVRAGAQGIDVTHAVDAKLNTLRAQLPVGYQINIGGSVEESAKAQKSINAQMPLMAIAVFTLLMIQLQSFSRVLMVVLTAPLGLIGVVATLLLFGQPFGFVAMLGVIAMFGIIMRNSVILVDQIEQDIAVGHRRIDAIIGATVRRFRPITLTAAAAVLALIPLLRSNFFGPMATALMGGITSATVLTLFYLPALYATWFRVKHDERDRRTARRLAARLPRRREPDHGSIDEPENTRRAGTRGGEPRRPARGCAWFAPSGEPPAMPSPAHYGATPQVQQTVSAQGVAQQFEVGAKPVPDWWKQYRSDALNALVDEGLRNSPTLSAASHSLDAAREQRGQIGSSMLPSIDAGGGHAPACARRADSRARRADAAVRHVRRAAAGELHDRPVRRVAFREPGAGPPRRRQRIPARIRSARAGREHRHRVDHGVGAECADQYDRAARRARQRSGARCRTPLRAWFRLAQRALNARQSADTFAASLPALRQQRDSARHALAVLVGRTPDQPPADLTLADLHLPEQVPVVVPSDLLQSRPDIQAADAG